MRRLLLALCCLGCGTEIDPAGLPSIEGYESWHKVEVSGFVPGHGDTVRLIFVNDRARTYPHAGRYAVGTVIVKEVRERTAGGGPGALMHLNIMRKLTDDEPAAVPVDRGWVFTDRRGGKEVQKDSCWQQCHRQGPFDYAWFDYGE
jgi:hypothetical protein